MKLTGPGGLLGDLTTHTVTQPVDLASTTEWGGSVDVYRITIANHQLTALDR